MTRRPTPGDFDTGRLERLDQLVETRTLANGMHLVYVPSEAPTPRFFVGMLIGAGARLEAADEIGISHFLEHMMFRGSAKYPAFSDLAREFEWLGGEWNAETGYEMTHYWYAGVEQTAAPVVELFAEFLTNPVFGEIDIERRIIMRELDAELNEYDNCTDLDTHIASLLWPGSTLARSILGSKDSLANIDLAKLKAYRDRLYIPRNMVVYASGGERETVLDRLTQHFEKYRTDAASRLKPSLPLFTKNNGPSVRCVKDSDNEYQIQLSFRTHGEWSEEAIVYELIGRILTDGFGARLNKTIREKLGLVYDIDAAYHHRSDTGSFDITAVVLRENFDTFFDCLYSELERLTTQGPTDEELELVRVRTIVDLELTSPPALASRVSSALLAGKAYTLTQERERLNNTTKSAIQTVCRDIFCREKAALAVIGPEESGLESALKASISRFRSNA